MTTAEELKALGNDAFVKNEFRSAEEYYTKAIDLLEEHRQVESEIELSSNSSTSSSSSSSSSSNNENIKSKSISNMAILYTNRSAARIHLGMYEEGLMDASRAIVYDSLWVKAYYRKAYALEKLNQFQEAYKTWEMAYNICEKTEWLMKQFRQAKLRWIGIFYTIPIESQEDFISRYRLLEDPREKLSTLAHFWNESTQEERLRLLFYFISLIGGQGELSSDVNQSISMDMMLPMPLHNYEDLPRSRIILWCDYFRLLSIEDKIELMTKIYNSLSSDEQTAVITDLKLFVSNEMQAQLSGKREEEEDDDNDGEEEGEKEK